MRQKGFTKAEKNNQSRFRLASKFAQAALTDPVQKARYEEAAKGTDGSAQNVAVSDFMMFPTLAEIDLTGYTGRAGELIKVRAEEGKVGAVEVTVVIADSAKATLEQGAAVMEKDGKTWIYAAQGELPPDQAVWITVTARDQPGNETTKTLRHTTGS